MEYAKITLEYARNNNTIKIRVKHKRTSNRSMTQQASAKTEITKFT